MGKSEKPAERASNEDAAPPSYNPAPSTSMSPEDVDRLNSAFASLKVPQNVKEVTAETCLVHLKLLFAFQNLKESIGYTDGLWQIYDSRVLPDTKGANALSSSEKLDDKTIKNLSLVREKRWALYLARAVDRYEAWWNSFPKQPLTEQDMCEETPRYTLFASGSPPHSSTLTWESIELPPLDVLMVWHAHMLNPRAYLEDCIRSGLRELWHKGMPWQLINEAIDTNFNYTVSPDCMKSWKKSTGRRWDNVDDPSTKTITPCLQCGTVNTAPWSTCGQPEGVRSDEPDLQGTGYGDRYFEVRCSQCGWWIDRSHLEVYKFTTDVKALVAHGDPMPGTILKSDTGKPQRLPLYEASRNRDQRTFPSRLIRYHLRTRVYDPPPKSLDEIRIILEDAIRNSEAIQEADRVEEKDKKRRYKLGREARMQVRKMMSRYWGNSSPFALELGGAVMRQGIFVEKMYKIDWLHSPAAHETMTRLITKYDRFASIMGNHPTQVVVPTLDVDLAWHTHQLSPAAYYAWIGGKVGGRFVDHDDKIEENALSAAFEWTSKTYQETYGEVYSECTCWYCESVRASHSSGGNRILEKLPGFRSEKSKATETFHTSGRAALCPPDNSAHISAHNSITMTDTNTSRSALNPNPDLNAETNIRGRVQQALYLARQKRLEDNYEKARRRARRRGRDLPPRDDHYYYYYYWGAPYALYAPFVYPPYFACPVYGACDVAAVPAGSGAYGACAAGSCGGGVAAGACSGGGGGGGGGTVGCSSASGPVCGGGGSSGGGGGGCGGGGGGCGGGGGGGGCGGGGS